MCNKKVVEHCAPAGPPFAPFRALTAAAERGRSLSL